MGGGPPVSSLDPARFKLGSESDLAYALKWEAWEWLYSEARCRCIGLEVRLQGPWGKVVDLVGVGPGNAIYVVEVKASRADFARDNHTEADIDRLRRRQEALRRRIELAHSPGYQSSNGDVSRLEQEAERLRERLATVSTKFHNPRFLANRGLPLHHGPKGCGADGNDPARLGLAGTRSRRNLAQAPAKAIRKNTGIVSNVLRAIARANTTAMMRARGVAFGADGATFPRSGDDKQSSNAPLASIERTSDNRLPEEKYGRNHD